jgi:RimJ/RimL family protein N-acetyltransferase
VAAAQLSDLAWPIATERLVLRPAERRDEDAIWAYRHDEDTARWLSTWPTERASFHPATEQADEWARMIVIERNSSVIGNVLIRIEDPWAQFEVRDDATGTQAEVGWVLHRDHVGHGYATEAVHAVLEICFNRLRLRRVVAGCFAANTASWTLMERVGMRREQHAVADALHRSGRWMDSFGYALLAEEWRRRQQT